MSAAEHIAETLSERLAAHDLALPDNAEPGRLVRMPGAGKPQSNRAGWLKIFPDGEGAVFGDWSTGLSETWQARNPRDNAEYERWREQAEEARQEAAAQRAKRADRAAQTAADTWAEAEAVDTLHGYLVAKQVNAHGLRQHDGDLLVPVYVDNILSSIQRIKSDGEKRFMPGGATKGGYHLVGDPAERIIIAEGYATAASIYESTGQPVAVAFNCHNLLLVAEAIRAKHPDAEIIIAADDDRETEGNPGIKQALEAARAVNALLATPGRAGDFNDLHVDEGAEAVRERIEQAEALKKPGTVELEIVRLDDLHNADIPDPPHVIDQLLPVGVASSLAGHGGTGKTSLALYAAGCVATGRRFMGLEVKQVPVLMYSAEDGADVIRYRLKQIIDHEAIPASTLAENLHVIDATNIDPALFIERNERDEFGSTKRGFTTPAFRALTDKAVEVGAGLVVIDNASDTFEANENERARVRGFIRSLAQMAREIDGAVLLLSHVDKATAKSRGSTEGYSGSTAWHNSVRSRMFLHGEGRNMILEHQKANFGPLADDLLMHWEQGVLMAGHVEGVTRDQHETDLQHTAAILAMIDERSERGNFISTSRTAGNAYGVLNALNGFPRIDRRTFWRLMDEAETAGRLIRDTYRDENRKAKERFTVTDDGKRFIQTMST